ncbi:MAG TPA: AAA family ATPase [Candidatus Magasanikbacteria bacterium]|nr:AAA family ATPase [Candidatus Magasanikbacteria bacterium]
MYLKRLEIQGFKSFANKTILNFLPQNSGRFSITGVVGPNGSGKSNITDAIRWVMGEQSLKTLRGKKSEDVIFSGSQSKGQLGMAEVILTLDNSDTKILPEYAEVVITRRLYRNGDSEYLINGAPARLFDIHLLLAKAQFAENSYGVIGQGTIDQLLIVSPAERKDFLDEASGIKEFQIKRHQSQLKLNRSLENMTNAERLIAEVEPHLKMLHKQVKKLEKRQEVEVALRAAQESYYLHLYWRNRDEEEVLQQNLQTTESEIKKVQINLENIQVELANLARASTRQENFNELQNKYQEAVREKNSLEREIVIVDGQMHTQYSQRGQQNIGWLENKVKELQSSRDGLLNQLQNAQSDLTRLENEAGKQRKEIERLHADRAQRSLKINKLQNQMLESQSEQNYLQISGLTSVKAVLEAKASLGKIFGLVGELGQVEEDYRLALDVAAGNNLTSLVVEDEDVAKKAIEYLRERRLGVATFLPLNKVAAREQFVGFQDLLNHEDVLGSALDFVKYDKKYENIFSFILGNTLVVRDLSAAKRVGIGKCRMVTLQGDLVERQGVMKGGFRQNKNNLGFSGKVNLTGEERIKDLQLQLVFEQQSGLDLEKELESAKGKLINLEVEIKTAKAKSEFLTNEDLNLEKEAAGLNKELSFLKLSPEEYGQQMKKLSLDKEDLLKKMSASENKLKIISAEMEKFNQKEEEKKQRVFALQEEMQNVQNNLNVFTGKRNDLRVELAKIQTKQESLNEEVKAELNEAISLIVERLERDQTDVNFEELAGDIQKHKYQLSLIGGIDEEVITEYEQTKTRYDFLTAQINDLKKAIDDLEKMIIELDEIMRKKRATAFKKIRSEFGRYFKILFEGGEADLKEIYSDEASEEGMSENASLPDGDAVAELIGEMGGEVNKPKKKDKVLVGIDISANPPGKKIKSINALSGGERTLTSIALICAILNYNPSPFVVLDEVEAALDEVNTLRFAKIMNELSHQSQFIIITHNRVTMHHCDALYGVTMGADGVSKLLSVKMEEAVENQ